mmetsp:Transcript_17474/g.33126  ORF Transcript_17474/g.33126 Transcript_17474/m.33126 type:complete len:493 (+) Transcript_17474:408-1886(+)|eukprot:CAMPEP_0176486960 /NCGR_PEP_ID=MMETSP0200_2-20121128/5859_1 /TAXON_ID=947934 /ORGANISM="Chaetoceros sp., Strain GSL56" /LENGTH=492 /DNA_ID=CAMNT_0017883721 /DNA_START=366 /DNA_END=1844 /DNA_ORIENTATION=-
MLRSLYQTSRPFLARQRGGIPSNVTGGGNRVFTNGSGIGSDSSMIAANDRLVTHLFDKYILSTRALSTVFQRFGSNSELEVFPKNNITSRSDITLRSLSSSSSDTAGDGTGEMDDEYGEMTADGNTYVHPVPFVLENGDEIHNAQLRYMTYGTLNEKRDNVLVVCHALTGNASLHSWWGDLLGPGLAFDTEKYFIVCSNILGSCYGSTGPASFKNDTKGTDGGEKYGMSFPDISVQDTVRLQLHMLRDDLKVNSIKCVIGGSFGGMQAVEYAAQAGTIDSPFAVDDAQCRATPFVRSVIPIACGAAHTAWQIAMSEVQRQAIYMDPKWNNGSPSMDDPPRSGLSVARQIGMISYRTPGGYQSKFGRKVREPVPAYGSKAKWEVKSYLEYQGYKFLSRFDPITYLKLTEQMDTHDVGRNRGGKVQALSSVKIPAMVLGIDSDILYPIKEQEELAELFPNGELGIIHSDAGHDGFLLEQDQVAAYITKFLGSHD